MTSLWLQNRDHAGGTETLPGQPLNQSNQLLIGQTQLISTPGFAPLELAPVQPTGTLLDTPAIMNQHLHPIAPFVGKQIRTMRPGRAKHLNDTRQRLIWPGPHIQWLCGQPGLVSADHGNSSRRSATH